jgi:peptide/nickel transport system permease protein
MKQTNEKRYSFAKETIARLLKNKLAVFGMFVLCVLVLTAVFADHIAPYAYDEMDLLNAYQPPNSEHIFGTDEFGRDIFSRVVYGSRISLKVGFIAVGISVVAGGLLGAVAGYYGGWTDNLIMRAVSERRGSTTMTIFSGLSENSRMIFFAFGIWWLT